MNHSLDIAHASPQKHSIGDRANVVGKRGRLEVDADRIVACAGQCAHESLTEVACASSDENLHNEKPGFVNL
jgi:hypothetical protein